MIFMVEIISIARFGYKPAHKGEFLCLKKTTCFGLCLTRTVSMKRLYFTGQSIFVTFVYNCKETTWKIHVMTRKKRYCSLWILPFIIHNPYPPNPTWPQNIFTCQLPSTPQKKQCQSRMPIPYTKQQKSTCIWINQTIIPAVTKSCESLYSHKTIHISQY